MSTPVIPEDCDQECQCTHDTCLGVPGETTDCKVCLALDPEAPCPADEGGEA